jgi:predicted LPLAT superfamily acyltransferase
MGGWVVTLSASVIALGYFLFRGKRRRYSVRFYRALEPEAGALSAYLRTLRQFLDFAHVYAERLALERGAHVDFTTEGRAHIQEARRSGRGAVVLMSHFGRWEIAARLLVRDNNPISLVIGVGKHEPEDKAVAASMRDEGIDVVAVRQGQGVALDILTLSAKLRDGAVVAIPADRAYQGARIMHLPFLSGEAALPVAPFALALATAAPLLVVFTWRDGHGTYRFHCDPPRFVSSANRSGRDDALRAAAGDYLARLEAMIREHPEQWHDFGEFYRARAAAPDLRGATATFKTESAAGQDCRRG